MKKWLEVMVLLMVFSMLAGGCVMQQGKEKLEALEFTVTKQQDLPAALQEQIEKKKEENFSLTYSDNEYLYLARGYGIQETGGYSISVDDCYRTENAICVKTTLHGPQVGEDVAKSPSYPYLVIKLELRSEPVIFQ